MRLSSFSRKSRLRSTLDISEVYNRVWSSSAVGGGGRAKKFFSRILRAFRPLMVDELAGGNRDSGRSDASIGARNEETAEWAWQDEILKFKPLDLGGDLLRLFGSLTRIEVDRRTKYIDHQANQPINRSRIQLVHLSVKDHFPGHSTRVGAREARLRIAEISLRSIDGSRMILRHALSAQAIHNTQ